MEARLQSTEHAKGGRGAVFFWTICYAVLGATIYAGTLHAPFIFDDTHNILGNRSIRSLSPLSELFFPSQAMGISGRPLVNASFALNYAVSGLAPWSYHAGNIAIHVIAACFLFGILRLMLSEAGPERMFGESRNLLAGLCGLLWLSHPIQTEAVTYVTNRCESLMGMLLLGTFYFSLKGWRATRRWPWHMLALVCFFLGVGVKEVIAAAPVLVFLYQVAILRVSPGRALRSSPLLYAGFATGLAALFWLLSRGGTTTALGTSPYTRWQYFSTQPAVLFHYLFQSFWPNHLCFDWKWPVSGTRDFVLYGAGIAALLALTVAGLVRRSLAGFAGAWFFLILAPTSSVVPLVKIACDYRMYLPLAAVVSLAVLSGYAGVRRLGRRMPEGSGRSRAEAALFILVLLAGFGLAGMSVLRNRVFSSSLDLWADTARKDPGNERARISLGKELNIAGKPREAIAEFQAALAADPDNYYALSDLASSYMKLGEPEKALFFVNRALTVHPSVPDIHYAAGNILARLGDMARAERHFATAVSISPYFTLAWLNWGNCRMAAGDPERALALYRKADEIEPGRADVHYNMAMALVRLGRAQEARTEAERALAIDPGYGRATSLLQSLSQQTP
ncbi:MAG: tetratricopeptide repeat protein [Thermodesulfobacteriota bacterium]